MSRNPHQGIPVLVFNIMEHRMIDRLAGVPEGTCVAAPQETFKRMMVRCGGNIVDQCLAHNPLSMNRDGYTGETRARRTRSPAGGDIFVIQHNYNYRLVGTCLAPDLSLGSRLNT